MVVLQEVRLSGLISTRRDASFRAANQMLASKLGVKESDVARFMREQKYTWHEVEDMRTMQCGIRPGENLRPVEEEC